MTVAGSRDIFHSMLTVALPKREFRLPKRPNMGSRLVWLG